MKKEELQKAHDRLIELLSYFETIQSGFSRFGGKKISKNNVPKESKNIIVMACSYIESNGELFHLLMEGHNTPDSQTYYYDEFKQIRNFGNDLSRFISRILILIEERNDV